MRKVTTLIIGAGQAGLSMSSALTARSIDHVLIERGKVANSWRTERWDSLRLLTPNWMNGLAGQPYDGPDPHGFMTCGDVAGRIGHFAQHIAAPVRPHTSVRSVVPTDGGYRVETSDGNWFARTLVLASGACNLASRPAWSSQLPPSVRSMTPMEYRRPEDLAPGGVVVVGASATGVQLALELQRSGRSVTLAVGEHVRAPRRYRGHDLLYWMDACGILSRRIEDADDERRARHVPSMQLIGSPTADSIDLNRLQASGVRLAGRAMGCADGRLLFSGSLPNVCSLADLKMNRLLSEIDDWIDRADLADPIGPVERFAPTALPASPPLSLDLAREGIATVLWATGYRPDYSWLHVPVFDHRGALRHDRGVVDAPGVYALGLPFLRTRKSSFLAGAGEDAEALANHLHLFLATGERAAA